MKGARYSLLLVPLVMLAVAISARAQEGERPGQRLGQRQGPELFAASCVHCHDTGGWGTRALAKRVPEGQAGLLKRRDLPVVLTRIAVRRGIGAMPPLTPTDLTDAELERLARWLEERN